MLDGIKNNITELSIKVGVIRDIVAVIHNETNAIIDILKKEKQEDILAARIEKKNIIIKELTETIEEFKEENMGLAEENEKLKTELYYYRNTLFGDGECKKCKYCGETRKVFNYKGEG